MNERGNVLEWRQPADPSVIVVDKQIYEGMTNLLADLLFDRAGGRQDDQAFLLRHCARLGLVLSELSCTNSRVRNLDA
jgi:hypothetical protein